NFKLEIPMSGLCFACFWCLEFGVSPELGAWNLELLLRFGKILPISLIPLIQPQPLLQPRQRFLRAHGSRNLDRLLRYRIRAAEISSLRVSHCQCVQHERLPATGQIRGALGEPNG